jgi:hypothetical protein
VGTISGDPTFFNLFAPTFSPVGECAPRYQLSLLKG